VQETVAGVTTSYLVADQNLTGYAQVMDELQGGAVTRTYTYGLSLISESQTLAAAPVTSFYGFDGHGSVRYLTSSTGAVTDTYDYDAFGNLISSTGSTPNSYLFAGEQFDSALGIYYNRARYYDQRIGRFWTMDTYEGDIYESLSLHKYLYVNANPVDNVDQCGMCLPSTTDYGNQVQNLIFLDFIEQTGAGNLTDTSVSKAIGTVVPNWMGGDRRPDLIDKTTFDTVGQVYEIKSIYKETVALAEVMAYAALMSKFDKNRTWVPGFTYLPPPILPLNASTVAFISRPYPGVITYCIVNQLELQFLAAMALVTAAAEITLNVGVAAMEEAMAY
jgi:RHS repeat-associated protein